MIADAGVHSVDPKSSPLEVELARYENHVLPKYAERLGRLILAKLPVGQKLQILDIGCRTGYPALQVLQQLGPHGRVLAIDPSSHFIDLARRKAMLEAGRRIFFKCEPPESLSFESDIFDYVIGNATLEAARDRQQILLETRRVLRAQGRLLLTQPLHGSFEEIFEALREISLHDDNTAIIQRLENPSLRYPRPEELKHWTRAAGFTHTEVHTETYQLTFAKATDIFRDPMIQATASRHWEPIAGTTPDSRARIMKAVEQTLDTYFGGGPLCVRLEAGLVIAAS